jgi:GWxTD domain-containing protein
MKTKHLVISLVLLLCSLPFGLRAENQARPVLFILDEAVFRYDSARSSAELYLSFPQSRMPYVKTAEGRYKWSGTFDLKILRGDSLVHEKQWRNENTVDDTSGIRAGVDFMDAIRLLLPPGEYRAVLYYRDLQVPAVQGSSSMSMTVPRFPADSVRLSPIEIAHKISKSPPDSSLPFYKNTLQVVPQPTHLYSPGNPFLYYYAESYNLDRLRPDTNYVFESLVRDAQMNPCADVEPVRRTKSITAESSVEWGAVRVGGLTAGKYHLTLRLTDNAGRILDAQTVPFFVYQPGETPEADWVANPERMYLSSEFAAISESEIAADFEKAEYLSIKNERKQYKELKELEAKRKWLFEFWRKRDSNPRTIENEFRMDYLRKVREANDKYHSRQAEGWKTDRGRIFLMYGEPSSVTRFPNESGYRPYEIWNYDNIQGGVEFVFVDFNLNNEYRLVHSSLRGEMQNSDWKNQAKKGVF